MLAFSAKHSCICVQPDRAPSIKTLCLVERRMNPVPVSGIAKGNTTRSVQCPVRRVIKIDENVFYSKVIICLCSDVMFNCKYKLNQLSFFASSHCEE